MPQHPLWWHRTLEPSLSGEDVVVVQRKLGLVVTGRFDTSLALAIRGFQQESHLPVTGVVDAATAEALGPRSTDHLLPDWWSEDIHPDDQGYIGALAGRDQEWLRRFQGNHGVTPTGVIDERTALLLGALS